MSGPVTLSFINAQAVTENGWGEGNRVSGTSWIHVGYTMVYMPRPVEEMEVFRTIFQAGVGYMRSA